MLARLACEVRFEPERERVGACDDLSHAQPKRMASSLRLVSWGEIFPRVPNKRARTGQTCSRTGQNFTTLKRLWLPGAPTILCSPAKSAFFRQMPAQRGIIIS
jgi:hypothetical protein